MKYIVFLLVILCSSNLFAQNYTVDSLRYTDIHGNIQTLIPSNKLLVNNGPIQHIGRLASPLQHVEKLVAKYGAIIRDVEPIYVGGGPTYLLTIDSTDNYIKLLNDNPQLLPVFTRSTGSCVLYNTLVMQAESGVDEPLIRSTLSKILRCDDFLLQKFVNFYMLEVKDISKFNNYLFLSEYISNHTILFKVEPYFLNLKFYNVTASVDAMGTGSIGEKRFINFEVIMPDGEELSEPLPLLSMENIINALDEESFNAPINEKFIKFYDPEIKRNYKKDDKQIYEVQYCFDIYQIGRFRLGPPQFNTNKGNTLNCSSIVYFNVVPLLGGKFLHTVPFSDFGLTMAPKYSTVKEDLFWDAVIITVSVLLIKLMFYGKQKKVLVQFDVVEKECYCRTILDSGFDIKVWKDQYCRLLKEIHNKDLPEELIEELEKAYSKDMQPDFKCALYWLRLIKGCA